MATDTATTMPGGRALALYIAMAESSDRRDLVNFSTHTIAKRFDSQFKELIMRWMILRAFRIKILLHILITTHET